MHTDDTGMPCESLLVKDGIATCLIYDSKPEVCKNYPNHPDFGGEPCFFNRQKEIESLQAQLKDKEEAIKLLQEYIELFGEEMDEIVPYAASHGWVSTRYEKGKELRKKIKQALKGGD
jgi:hypothetical protein